MSYAHAVGVQSFTVTNADASETLSDLRDAFKKPVALDVSAITYHNLTKKEKSNIKRDLPYFVGGNIKGKRRDDNVTQRTFLTLDIESKDQDGPFPPPPETIADKLEELGGAGWVYTSIGHVPDRPRYRVVLPLVEPIKTDIADTLKASTLAAAEKLGIKQWCTPESYVVSQPMYLPARLRGAKFYESLVEGKHWKRHRLDTSGSDDEVPEPETKDIVLNAIKKAGLYIRENPKHKGMHFFTCPWVDEHGAENDTQTVYYEAHFDGSARPAVKCFDTEPDVDGVPHLTYRSLCKWLVEQGHLDASADTGELEEYEDFLQRASLGAILDSEPEERDFAFVDFCPVGKVTVLAGPGGVSKSMLLLTAAIHGAIGLDYGPFKIAKGQALRTLVVSYEDDALEMHRRLNALTQALEDKDDGLTDMIYDINGSLRKNLLMYPADDDAAKWLLMRRERFEPAKQTERVNWLAGFCKEHKIKLLILDPAVYTHTLEETDPGDMAGYMQMLNRLAKLGECAIVLVHHMHKMAAWAQLDDINQGSLRGASSFADNARSVGVVVSLSMKDAGAYGLPAEHATTERFAVFKHVKHNYSSGLGVHFFERKGPLLVHRPEIQRMDDAEVAEQRLIAKDKRMELMAEKAAVKILAYLRDNGDGSTTNMVIAGSGVRRGSAKAYLDYCEEQEWVESSAGEIKNSVIWAITSKGRRWYRKQKAQSSSDQ